MAEIPKIRQESLDAAAALIDAYKGKQKQEKQNTPEKAREVEEAREVFEALDAGIILASEHIMSAWERAFNSNSGGNRGNADALMAAIKTDLETRYLQKGQRRISRIIAIDKEKKSLLITLDEFEDPTKTHVIGVPFTTSGLVRMHNKGDFYLANDPSDAEDIDPRLNRLFQPPVFNVDGTLVAKGLMTKDRTPHGAPEPEPLPTGPKPPPLPAEALLQKDEKTEEAWFAQGDTLGETADTKKKDAPSPTEKTPAPAPAPLEKKGGMDEQKSSLEKLRLMKDIVRMAELREKKATTEAANPAEKKQVQPPPVPGKEKSPDSEVKSVMFTAEVIDSLRSTMARAELALQEAEKKMGGVFDLFGIGDAPGKVTAAREAFEKAKKTYNEAASELHGAQAEGRLNELLALTEARRTEWRDKHPKRSGLTEIWEAINSWNLWDKVVPKLFGEDALKNWKADNEKSLKGRGFWGGAGSLISRGVYGAFSGRGVINLGLLSATGGALMAGDLAVTMAAAGAKAGFSAAGGYMGGAGITRAIGENIHGRKIRAALNETTGPSTERYEALLTRHAELAETLRRGSGKKQTEATRAELKKISEELVQYASTLEGGLEKLTEATGKTIERVATDRAHRETYYKGAGALLGATFGMLGVSQMDTFAESLNNPPVGAGVQVEQSNQSVWRPGQEAIVPPKMPAGEMASWDDVGKNQLDAAEQLKKALGLKESIPAHGLEKIAKANHLLDNPKDLKAALRAVVSIEINSDNRLYGEALESALTDLAYKATDSGDVIAIATLKKFFASINMHNVDVTDLDQTELHNAMLKKVNMHGAQGEVREDVQNKVHWKNRLVVTSDGEVRVLQAAGKEAATNVPEKKFLEELARKLGADPKSVSFKNGWGEVGMKLKGQEIFIKNPHSGFDTYEEIREHAEKQLVNKAKEAALENPLLNMDRTTVKDLRVYEHLKGIQGLEATLGKQPGISEYAVFVVDNNKLPSSMPRLDGGTKLIGADFRFAKDLPGTTDGKPELWVAAVEREDTPKGITLYKTIAGYGVDGTPNEALGAAIKHANTLKTNLDYAWQATGVSRAETIDLCKAMDIGLDKNATAQLADIKRSLDGDWSALKVDGAYDKTQIAVYKKLPSEFQGTRLQEALADTKTMIKLSVDERLALVAAEQSKKAEDLKALFGVDMKPGKGMQVIYNPDKLTFRVTNVEMAGTKMKEVILDTGSRKVFPTEDGWFGGKRLPTVTLDSLKKSSVR